MEAPRPGRLHLALLRSLLSDAGIFDSARTLLLINNLKRC